MLLVLGDLEEAVDPLGEAEERVCAERVELVRTLGGNRNFPGILPEQIQDLKNISGCEITIGGLTAYELLADAKDLKSGTLVRLYQVIAPDGGGYFIVQGLVGADR